MDKRILDHAAAIYARDVKKASEKHAQQIRDTHAEISRRGFQIGDGIAQGMIIAADASFVGEKMRIRLESLQEAFEDAGLQPPTEDFSEIWKSIEEVYSTCLAQDRANPSRLRGNILDRDIEPAAARHHDGVLAEFMVWRKGRLYRLHSTGDEFAVILPNCDKTEAMATAERIRSVIEDHNPGGEIQVTASIGCVVVTNEVTADKALSCADKAMYVAKQSKNKVHFDVLTKIPRHLESWKFLKRSDIELRLTSQILHPQGGHVVRRLETTLVNETNNRIEKYDLEIRIPSSLLKHWNHTYPSEVSCDIAGLRCFRFDQTGWSAVRPHDQQRLAIFEYCTTCAVNEHRGVGAIVAQAELSARIWIDGKEYQVGKTIKQLAEDRDSGKTS